MAMCVFISSFVYAIPIRGSLLALGLVSGVFLVAALALGLLISTIARSQLVAAQASMVLGFLPAFILSGFIFEIASMPLIIQAITTVLPARYFVTTLKTIFLVGDVWPLILKNLIPMLAMGLLLLAITAKKTLKRLD